MNRSTFGRKRDSRNLLIRNLASSVILYESVTTTEPKARMVQPIVDRLIETGKKADKLTARRQLRAFLTDEKAVAKVLDELAPRFNDVTSGYTRRIAVAPRQGDGAPQAMIQLTINARLNDLNKKEEKPAKEEKAAEGTSRTKARGK